ncbi:UNVERIFIED_CONTAM: F-box protein PP2-B10 [Sesamum latifolium]|uniref:F-box protein PP2-B10 n=1 Tax=Sesamum latifolium TaxID=2727402 RepID=A0AAW2XW98_9LAMI
MERQSDVQEMEIFTRVKKCYRMISTASTPQCRFGEVANLRKVYSLEISGRFQHCELDCSSKASVKFLNDGNNEIRREVANTVYIDPLTDELEMERNLNARVPYSRIDGWLELELGEFFVAEGDNWDVEARLSETEILYRKGVIVEGIEVRPKES